MKHLITKFLCALTLIISSTNFLAQIQFWTDITRGDDPTIQPMEYRVLRLDLDSLKCLLNSAPYENDIKAGDSPVVITLPMPNDTFEKFSFVHSPIMSPELAAKYPEIQVFLGQGIDSPSSTVRFDLTPHGFHAMILAEGKTIYIDPFTQGDLEHCISYTKASFYANNESDWSCGVKEIDEGVVTSNPDQKSVQIMGIPKSQSNTYSSSNGTTLRTYRLALACTGEYASYHGGTTLGALSAMNTTMARVNGVFEKDVCLRMILIDNNDDIIYLNGNTDPYTNSNGATMLSQNQTICNNVIGSSNYDIGHVFSTGGGGIASLQSPCYSSYKARGVTGRYVPIGDPFDIDYVAHEMGHQWGANHTQNNSCNRASNAAYEPGSASTIMGYAGICSPNLQNNSDDHFHNKSINEMISYTVNGYGNTCDSPISTGNSVPIVDAGTGGFYIPASTPFILKATASDDDGDAITYNWEQYDLGPATSSSDYNLTNPSGNQPIFRSWSSTSDPSRTFPRKSDLVNNTITIGEHMPTYTRDLAFKCSVRDNVAGGGAFDDDVVSFSVYGFAGPFLVTSPSGGSVQGGSQVEVTWDVAGTDAYPINCANVEISISTDGGNNFDTIILSSTPNDGSEFVEIPNITSYQTRFRVKAVGSIWFDISNINTAILFSSGVDGCTDDVACNFDPEATNDDGSCEYPAPWFDCEGNDLCPSDLNDNGVIDVGDVLQVLSDFSCLVNCENDITGDDMISVADILTLLSSFGDLCPE
tara:strand:+ start:152 stop:2422 length:2271 start_codon:yes stop_codon:yes gene_type:complete